MICLVSKNLLYSTTPAPRSIQPSDMMKFRVYGCNPTPWQHLKTMKSFIHTNTMWEHELARGEVHCGQIDPLGNLDKADVEIPAWKGLGRSLRSGPCACRELCPKSHPSSIFKLGRAFVLLLPLFWKHLDLTLKLFLIFATMYLHAFQVNKWWSNLPYDSLLLLFIYKLRISVTAKGK